MQERSPQVLWGFRTGGDKAFLGGAPQLGWEGWGTLGPVVGRVRHSRGRDGQVQRMQGKVTQCDSVRLPFPVLPGFDESSLFSLCHKSLTLCAVFWSSYYVGFSFGG